MRYEIQFIILSSNLSIRYLLFPSFCQYRDKMKERSVMNNYFGIGIDAKIALDFHNKREETQNKSGKSSRAKNYMWYGMLGSRELVQK